MNFLICDNELVSEHLIRQILNEFYHVKLFTTNQSANQTFSSSKFFSLEQGDISIAVDALKTFSQHENDPFDGILLFNLPYLTSLNNVLQALQRLTRRPPRIFLVFINQQKSIDENLVKTLRDSSQTIPWTIVFCNEINQTTDDTTTTCQIELKPHPANNQPISAAKFLEFLRSQTESNKYLNEIIYLY